jgi:nucleoid-associated protein YgaU
MNLPENCEVRLNRVRWAAAARRASAAFLSLSLMGISGVTEIRGQDVAGAARQEQTRKDAKAKRAKRVYTEEDLARARILTPEDRAQLEARQKQAAASGAAAEAKAAPEVEYDEAAPSVSLGEVARAYRAQKALTELEHTSDFHLFFENPVLAAPMVPARPLVKAKAPKVAGPRFSPPAASYKVIARPNEPAIAPRIGNPRFASPIVNSTNIGRPIEEAVAPAINNPRFSPATVVSSRIAPSVEPAIAPKLAGPRFLAPTIASVTILRPVEPMAEPMEAIRQQDRVTVQRGDSLWKLALKNLGAANRWQELLAANPSIVDPNYIQQGAQIRLPVTSMELGRSNVAKVRVQKGDTLWSIARRMLARATAWSCIAGGNPQITDPNRIYAGQVLNVPADCGTTAR